MPVRVRIRGRGETTLDAQVSSNQEGRNPKQLHKTSNFPGKCSFGSKIVTTRPRSRVVWSVRAARFSTQLCAGSMAAFRCICVWAYLSGAIPAIPSCVLEVQVKRRVGSCNSSFNEECLLLVYYCVTGRQVTTNIETAVISTAGRERGLGKWSAQLVSLREERGLPRPPVKTHGHRYIDALCDRSLFSNMVLSVS